MNVYHKILVTIDCSPVDETVLKHVAALAIQNEAIVYLLHVVHSHTLDQNRDLTQIAEIALSKYSQQLRDQGISVEVLLRSGEPETEIFKEIQQQDFDLVAMGTHGHSLLESALYGSVSRSLKYRISIPLLLIRSPL
ncbi:MAG: universal stress protein [Sedimentibacter sp.]